MKSLASSLVNRMLLAASLIVIVVFAAVDISIDKWVDSEFDNALMTKSNALKNLINVSDTGVSFDFSDEFMPEFSHSVNAEYFQLWHGDVEVERSVSLGHFPDSSLIKHPIALNSSEFYNVTLPDGRAGRAMVSHFTLPVTGNFSQSTDGGDANSQVIWLTLAVSSEELSDILWGIDYSLAIGFFLIIVLLRWMVVRLIHQGFAPINALNQTLQQASERQQALLWTPSVPQYLEIEPIKQALNDFVQLTQHHLKNEKRLTADIAHELKTPLSELISLSEMAIRYPNDQRIAATYQQDVLAIGLNMKGIVNNLLLLQQVASGNIQLQRQSIDLIERINSLVAELTGKYADASQRVYIDNQIGPLECDVDSFSLQTILVNLLDNALFYSPPNTPIQVTLRLLERDEKLKDGATLIHVEMTNQLKQAISDSDLTQLSLPLYQVEQSRTDNNRHGLGLAIVANIAQINQLKFSYCLQGPDKISFSFVAPSVKP